MSIQRDDQHIIKEVLGIFAAHLEKSGLRKTPERFAILDILSSPLRANGDHRATTRDARSLL